jgi:hypothetical protein
MARGFAIVYATERTSYQNPPDCIAGVPSRHEKALGKPQGLIVVSSSEPSSSVIHAAHTAHAATGHGRSFPLRMLGDRRLGGDDQARDRRGVLEGRADELGRIDNAELDKVAVLAGLRIVARSGEKKDIAARISQIKAQIEETASRSGP